MNNKMILTPFSSDAHSSSFSLEIEVQVRERNRLCLLYHLSGPQGNVLWPPIHTPTPLRADGLWQNTCWELFLTDSLSPQSPYLEINASPSGNWNAYHFASYREGMTPFEKIHVQIQPHQVSSTEALYELRIQADSDFSLPLQFLHPTAVIEWRNGEKSYWAPAHPTPKPDFHDKSAWSP